MPVRVLRFKNLPSVPLLVQDRNAVAETRQPERVCVCGKCSCRRHHCPIHHFPDTLGQTQQQEGVARETDYSETFRAPAKGARRGLKLPLVLTRSELGKKPSKVTTEHGAAYKQFVGAKPAQSFQHKEEYVQSTAPLSDETSYKAEFQQPGPAHLPHPQYGRHLQSTLCLDDRSGVHYGTTNTEHFQGRQSGPPERPSGELVGESLFRGSFQGTSVMQSDFNPSVVCGAKPSTSCKKLQECHRSDAPFQGSTTTCSDFLPPALGEKVAVRSKRKSKKNAETMQWSVEPQPAGTLPHPTLDVAARPHPRAPLCLTVPTAVDLTHSTQRSKGPAQSVSQSTYSKSWPRQPKPRTSYKVRESYTHNHQPFEGDSSTHTHFKAVSPRQQDALLREVDCRAAELSYQQQLGAGMKRASTFASSPFSSDTTTTQQSYQPWRVQQHVRQGDQVERCFQRSLEPFDMQSLHQSAYTWVRAQPAETCKPLDARFSKGGWLPREEVGVSSYRSEFKELELPQATRCPAHSLLYPTNN